MSKEVNNNKINIGKELLKKQIFDCSIIFIALGVIFYFVRVKGYENYDLFIVLLVAFLVIVFLLEYSKNAVKQPLNKIIVNSIENTIGQINSAQSSNTAQKEKNALSINKIKDIQQLIENLQKNSVSMKEVTNQTKEKTDNSLSFTNNEYTSVKGNIEKMFSIRHKIQTIAELILELSDFVQSISSTVGLVEDIAEQTNLLALNAAVEAARAGEHGKGFAVVAGEIRKLADESKQATTKITSLITDIQQTTNSTVIATEEGTKEIESGIDLAHNIGSNVESLINIINEISTGVAEIDNISKTINKGTNETDSYIKGLNSTLENANKTLETTTKKLDNINQISKGFKNTVVGE